MMSHKERVALPLEQRMKRFYARFRAAERSFLQYIQGIPQEEECRIYASLLLKRLLVLYFLQKHALLDEDVQFLTHLLWRAKQRQDDYAFYCYYLLPLFQQLCGQQPLTLPRLSGRLPVLTLSLFQKHKLEYSYPCIRIADEAFIQLFAFFETYQWQLNPEKTCTNNELYPDILAYIFEQQITQKHMGVYYTREDVTTYIAQNTIIPYLLTTVSTLLPENVTFWRLLQNHPERYIYQTVQTMQYLQEETEREYTIRRAYSVQLSAKLSAGAIHCVDDLITYNLNILQFALDILASSEDPQFLIAFYTQLQQITILDPTCGSGAFLLAALNILLPLYRACINRLDTLMNSTSYNVFRDSSGSNGSCLATLYADIRKQVAEHPNQQHFFLTQIITKNLYGVELMPEAVDLCTLRLYLLLLSHTKQFEDIQPLPPTNIVTGNALIGTIQPLISPPALLNQVGTTSLSTDYKKFFAEESEEFHWSTTFPSVMARGGFDVIIGNPPYVEYSKVRQEYIVHGYEEKSCGNLYAAVIERALLLCREGRSYLGLIVPLSICGSARFAELRTTLLTVAAPLWLANFEIFPSRLFQGAFQRLSILLARHNNTPESYSPFVTRIHRWYTVERPHLIALMRYTVVQQSNRPMVFPKLGTPLQENMLLKVRRKATGRQIGDLLQAQKTPYFVYYQEATNYWVKAVCHIPFYKKDGIVMEPAHGRILFFSNELLAHIIMALLNSSLFYVWFATYSDGFHLSHNLVKDFPIDNELLALKTLPLLAQHLEEDIQKYARRSTRNTQLQPDQRREGHRIELEEYYIVHSKPLLDAIDTQLAAHFGFTAEELDFIVNYDIKYRMGHKH